MASPKTMKYLSEIHAHMSQSVFSNDHYGKTEQENAILFLEFH